MACYFIWEDFNDLSLTAVVRKGFSPSITVVHDLFHVWYSAFLLLPDFHRGKIDLLVTWHLISLHLKKRFSSLALMPRCLLTEGFIAVH